MFGRKKIKCAEGVEAICGFKDSEGVFWETYAEALHSTENHRKIREEGDVVEVILNAFPFPATFDHFDRHRFRSALRGSTKEMYLILQQHYGKEVT